MRTTARTLAAAFAVVAVVVVLAAGLAGAQKEYETLPFKDDFGTAELVYSGGYRIADKVINLRRKLHAVPGVMYEEYEASRIVLSALKSMGIKDSNIETGLGVTGVIAHIGFGSLAMSKEDSEIPTIVLRADMDALPIHEETDVPFKSTVPGVMHACGHDAHTAMLLGAAMALKAVEEELITMKAAVRLFFQPAEEGGAGAKAMIDAGAIEGADAALMLHVGSSLDSGIFRSGPGLKSASCYTFHVIVHGVGAHGAAPHMSKDPMTAAGAIISGVHQIVSRTVDPTDSAVISIGYINGGKAFNVIPDEVSFGGTIRLLDMAKFDAFFATLTERIRGIAEAYGCTAEVINRDGETRVNSKGAEYTLHAFPPLVNDADVVALGLDTAARLFGEDAAEEREGFGMGCEDFAFLAQTVPSASFSIGTKHPDHAVGEKTGVHAHNELFDIDERALPRGAAFLSTMALRFLHGASQKIDRGDTCSAEDGSCEV